MLASDLSSAEVEVQVREGQLPVPVAGRVAAMAPPGLASQCGVPGHLEAKPSVPAQPWVGARLPAAVGPVAKTLCKRQEICQREKGALKKDRGEGEENHRQGLGTGRRPCSPAVSASLGPLSALFEADLPQTPAAMTGCLDGCTPSPTTVFQTLPPGAKHCLYLVDTAHRRLFGTSDHIGADANDVHLAALWGQVTVTLSHAATHRVPGLARLSATCLFHSTF